MERPADWLARRHHWLLPLPALPPRRTKTSKAASSAVPLDKASQKAAGETRQANDKPDGRRSAVWRFAFRCFEPAGLDVCGKVQADGPLAPFLYMH